MVHQTEYSHPKLCGEGLERKTLTNQVRGVGAAPTFRSNDSKGFFISQLLQRGKGSRKLLPLLQNLKTYIYTK